MDPISALILAGILSMLVTRTVASGVTDAIAQSKGETPPSLEKWRKRQADRAARGLAPEKEPGAWRRRWRNSVEHRNAKAAQKHAARMEHLRDNGPENVAKHKARLRKRADRWDKINDTAAQWGSASWDAAKNAARNAKDRLDERRAWKENERRDQELVDPPIEPVAEAANGDPAADTSAGDGQDAQVIPLRPNQSTTGCPWIVPGTGQPCGLPPLGSHPYCADHCDVARIPGCLWGDGNPAVPACNCPRVQNHPFCAAHLAEYERRTGTNQDPSTTNTNTNSEGNPTVTAPTHSGEITDLASALAYVTASSNYCNTITGTFETAQAQAESTGTDLQRQLATLETAQATLTGQGFDASVTGHLAAVSEHFTTLVNNMKQVGALLAATQEAINAAKSELNTSANVFRAQMGISEQVQSHQSVAKSTSFYANA